MESIWSFDLCDKSYTKLQSAYKEEHNDTFSLLNNSDKMKAKIP